MPTTPTTSPTELMDDEHKRDARGRRMAEAQRKADIVASYAASGLTQKAYARREGVNYHTFVSWLSRSRRQPAAARPAREATPRAPRFAELTWPAVSPTVSRVEVMLPDGVTLRGDDPAAMLILLRELAPRQPC